MRPVRRSPESCSELVQGLPDEDLLTLGHWLAACGADPQVPAYLVADTLFRSGLARIGGHAALVRRLLDASSAAGFQVRDGFVSPVDSRSARERAASLWNGTTPAPAPTPVSSSEVRPRPKPRPIAPHTEPAARQPVPPRPEPVAARALASHSAGAPTPPAPPVPVPPLAILPLDLAVLTRSMVRASSDTTAISLALRAHALSAAAAFHDLVGAASLRGVDPHAYQIETVRRVLRVLRGRALLADEVGLGKTVEAIMVLREYQVRGMARRVLVVAPPALVRHWAGELADKAGIVARTTEDPRLREDPDAFWSGEGVVVASLALARSARHAPLVQSAAWDLAIIDEAHHVKNRQTASWKLVDGIKSRFLLLLTATPVETDLEEIYNLVTVLKPGQLTTPAEFRRQFVDPKDPTAPRDPERLRRLLADVMVRNTRAQSGLALPPRYVTTVAVDPTDAERALYDAIVSMLRDGAADAKIRMATTTLLLEAGSSAAAVRATLERIGGGDKHTAGLRARAKHLARVAAGVDGSRKLQALYDIVSGADRVLVFTRFRETLEHIAADLRRRGVEPAAFHGGMRADERHASIERFRGGARVLLATDVGGEGQNLQFCQTLVNFDLPWNPMLIEQRIGRLHRMGQTGEVRVFNLCARGTVEDRVLDVLDRRLHLFELVVGEMDMVLGNLADERDLEERILDLYASARADEDVVRGFDQLAEEMAAARGSYERVRALDEVLFRQDFEA